MGACKDEPPRPRILLVGAVVLCLVAGLLSAFATGTVGVPLDSGARPVQEAIQFLVGVVVAAVVLAVVLVVVGRFEE